MTKTITAIVIAAVTAGVIGYDIWVAVEPTPGDTISAVLLGWATSYPVLPFAWGGLAGHLFWPMTTVEGNALPIPFTAVSVHFWKYRCWALGALITATIALGAASFAGILEINPAIPLVVGLAAGHWGWPQFREHRR